MSFSRYLFYLMKVCKEVICIYNRLWVNSSKSLQNVVTKCVGTKCVGTKLLRQLYTTSQRNENNTLSWSLVDLALCLVRTCRGLGECPGGDEAAIEQRDCKERSCVAWTEWGSWSKCSASCGVGRRERVRVCGPAVRYLDTCPGADKETEQCDSGGTKDKVKISPENYSCKKVMIHKINLRNLKFVSILAFFGIDDMCKNYIIII